MTVEYINNNTTDTFKKGDEVIMRGCVEAELPQYKDKVLICKTDSYKSFTGMEMVFLEGFIGNFSVKFLSRKEAQP